jgi:spermidine dehydrogenase
VGTRRCDERAFERTERKKNGIKRSELGMGRKITRRDFLDGVALAVSGAAVAGPLALASEIDEESQLSSYPPGLTGLRGDQEKIYEFAHKLRDGKKWDSLGAVEEEKDSYDLVVAGAGISGLAAAYFLSRTGG